MRGLSVRALLAVVVWAAHLGYGQLVRDDGKPVESGGKALRGNLANILEEEARMKATELRKKKVRETGKEESYISDQVNDDDELVNWLWLPEKNTDFWKNLKPFRSKRSIIDIDAIRRVKPIAIVSKIPALPSEPLSERVETSGEDLWSTSSNEEKSHDKHETQHSRRRLSSHPTVHEQVYEPMEDNLDQTEGARDYSVHDRRKKRSVNGDKIREKRSHILGFPSNNQQEMKLSYFPPAERSRTNVHHEVSSSLVPPDLDPRNPENYLTREDIRDVTRKSDLGQILSLLEALSQGRQHDVTAALLVAKKKLRRNKNHEHGYSDQQISHGEGQSVLSYDARNENRQMLSRTTTSLPPPAPLPPPPHATLVSADMKERKAVEAGTSGARQRAANGLTSTTRRSTSATTRPSRGRTHSDESSRVLDIFPELQLLGGSRRRVAGTKRLDYDDHNVREDSSSKRENRAYEQMMETTKMKKRRNMKHHHHHRRHHNSASSLREMKKKHRLHQTKKKEVVPIFQIIEEETT